MIQFLLDHWESAAHLVLLTAGALSIYYKLKGRISGLDRGLSAFRQSAEEHWSRIDADIARIDVSHESHLADVNPHQNCPVHTASIEAILHRLDRIQVDISGLREDMLAQTSQLNRAILAITLGNGKRVLGE